MSVGQLWEAYRSSSCSVCVCVCKNGGWFTSPAAPDRSLSGYWVIIIKMKHPVGKPETRMLLLQDLLNNTNSQRLTCLCLFHSLRLPNEKGLLQWDENMGKWRKKKTEGIKPSANSLYAHSAHSQITAIISSLLFRFILWRPFWIRVAPCLP